MNPVNYISAIKAPENSLEIIKQIAFFIIKNLIYSKKDIYNFRRERQ